MPTQEQMLDWIRTLTSFGVRRPGFEADARAERWIAGELERFGVADVRLEPIDVMRWQEDACHLEVRSDGRAASVDAFPVPFSMPADGVSAEVVLDTFDQTRDASALAGKIALYSNTHIELPTSVVRDGIATRAFDPDHDFDTLVHRLPFGPRILDVMAPEESAGALGFIGIVGQGWASNQYFVPYDARPRSLPGVWITQAAGAELLEALRAGRRVEATLFTRATQTPARSHNVIGVLPADTDAWAILGTHHDAPWLGAVEDASGVALVLAQALHWARVPEAQRPFNLLFLFNGGHMSGGAGILRFVEDHRDVIDRSVVAIHLEHLAREPKIVEGRLEPSDRITPRWWFTSRIAPLEDAVERAIQQRDLRRSLILPPKAFFEHPPTDGAFLYPAGVPIVQLLAAPEYLFDAGDTVPMVDEESLLPVTHAVTDLIESLTAWDGPSLRKLDRDRAA